MALIAQKVLKVGFTIAALPGTVVPKEAVDEYGWHDYVQDDGNGEINAAPDQQQGAEGSARAKRNKKPAAAQE